MPSTGIAVQIFRSMDNVWVWQFTLSNCSMYLIAILPPMMTEDLTESNMRGWSFLPWSNRNRMKQVPLNFSSSRLHRIQIISLPYCHSGVNRLMDVGTKFLGGCVYSILTSDLAWFPASQWSFCAPNPQFLHDVWSNETQMLEYSEWGNPSLHGTYV